MRFSFNNKYFRFLIQVSMAALTLPLKAICKVTPVSKNTWVFGNTYGYKDNPKYVYEYLIEQKDTSIRPIWISREKKCKTLGESYYCFSLKGLYYQYRASVAILATGMNDVAAFSLANKKIVQLWHGIPIKKLLLDSPETSPIPTRFKMLNRIFFALLKRKLNKYAIVTAVNPHNQQCLAHAFGLPLEKVKVTGMPRHDMILSSIKENERFISNKILYAPTWHASLEDARVWVNQVLSTEFLLYCNEYNIEVDVSIHPLNKFLYQEVSEKAGVSILECDDVNLVLYHYDLLITDYSSIAFDYSILDRPVIFSCAEIARYAKERGIYDDFIMLLESQNVTGLALIEKVDSLLSNKRSTDSFYTYPYLGSARARVIEEVKKIS
ncbi:CDP-glycerol glycerophosphotransferase family protein [Photobacterium japonica]|uniref:CDP-glycerol glycerophosphotransferase family protein n=1 Tax=Photobacterium japonica TaxID=2910235 RepID=UPI003D0F64E8